MKKQQPHIVTKRGNLSTETTREAVAKIDAACPWLRGVKFRTKK